jgi:hypothetical protein
MVHAEEANFAGSEASVVGNFEDGAVSRMGSDGFEESLEFVLVQVLDGVAFVLSGPGSGRFGLRFARGFPVETGANESEFSGSGRHCFHRVGERDRMAIVSRSWPSPNVFS